MKKPDIEEPFKFPEDLEEFQKMMKEGFLEIQRSMQSVMEEEDKPFKANRQKMKIVKSR